MAKILIDVPSYEHIENETFKSVYDLDKGGNEVDFMFTVGYGVDMARNRMADHARDGGYDFILMLDNDVVLPKDALVNLLEHDADICMGFYRFRQASDGDLTCLFKHQRGWDRFTCSELRELRENGQYTIRVKGGGMGCALVRTSVFDRFKYPWFAWHDNPDRTSCGEDIDFCLKCDEHGIPIYADTRVACDHPATEMLSAR